MNTFAQRVRRIPGLSAALLVTAALAAVSLAIAQPVAHAGSVAREVTVRIAGTNDGGVHVTDGGVAGTGYFRASGAITDRGTVTGYRTVKGPFITLRFVSVGKKGTITFVVKIDTNVGTSRWTIASGTKAYRGLHGKGIERENADYTVSILTGTVWR
jgi:hypothetical protein